MSFIRFQQEKDAINDLMARVESFVETAGGIYENPAGSSQAKDFLLASVSLKLKSGEALLDELTERIMTEKNKHTKALLEQLTVTVSNECKNLVRMKQALGDYQAAKRQEDVVAREEMFRRIRMGMKEYAGEQE